MNFKLAVTYQIEKVAYPTGYCEIPDDKEKNTD